MTPSETIAALFGSRPFFGGETAGVQTPLIEESLVLTAIVSSVARDDRPISVLEVGSWVGFSALTWAHAIAAFSKGAGSVTCVDTWEPYFTQGELHSGQNVYRRMDALARSGLAFDLFRHNATCGPQGVAIKALRGESARILPDLPRAGFDIVYLDGSHYYEAVRNDLMQGTRLVAEGGILCGDDLELQIGEIEESVVRSNLHADCVKDPQAGWYHPGVTLAVHEALGFVSGHGRTWFMQKVGDTFRPVDLSGERMMLPPHWPEKWQEKAATLLRPEPMTSNAP